MLDLIPPMKLKMSPDMIVATLKEQGRRAHFEVGTVHYPITLSHIAPVVLSVDGRCVTLYAVYGPGSLVTIAKFRTEKALRRWLGKVPLKFKKCEEKSKRYFDRGIERSDRAFARFRFER